MPETGKEQVAIIGGGLVRIRFRNTNSDVMSLNNVTLYFDVTHIKSNKNFTLYT